jgi:arginyl-tRNA synthetase
VVHQILEQRLRDAVLAVIPDAANATLLVRPCDPKFGDYQTNALMALAKERRINPRSLAEQVKSRLDVTDLCESVEIAGAAFLNFRLKAGAFAAILEAAARDEHLFFTRSATPRTVVIDFSSPNVAKPMHVGHIRSTGMGDCLQRVLRLLGHRVISDNHLGDWGTQFGMLLLGSRHFFDRQAAAKDPIEELVRIYKLTNFACELPAAAPKAMLHTLNEVTALGSETNKAWAEKRSLSPEQFDHFFAGDCLEADYSAGGVITLKATGQTLRKYGYLSRESDAMIEETTRPALLQALQLAANPPAGSTLMDAAREELVRLQRGDPESTARWREMVEISRHHFDSIYHRLGVRFDQTLGESFYNSALPNVVADLLARGLARESEGAVVVFSDGSMPPKEDPFLVNRDGEWVADPALIRKRDGGFNYMTTDLATLEYRLATWAPDEIIYVVDDRQAPHFRKLFLTFARWRPEAAHRVALRHVGFGKILGDDGKPYKTRSGDTVKLADLLDEAEQRAFDLVNQKRPELPESERREISRIVGIGAVKYQDLLPNRQSDYVFNWDKMLALTGNTAVYLLYAYTRTRSLARNAANDFGLGPQALAGRAILLAAPEELALAKHLLTFGLTLEAVAADCRPNFLCNYLYELAGLLSRFWEGCPVLKAEEPQRSSRLLLVELTSRVLKQGLEALGIETTEVM